MIHSNTKIQWMDINDQEFGNSPVSKFFQRYSVKAKRISDDEEVITFDKSDNVKVKDWTGWTEVQAIHKIKNIDGIWRIIRVGERSLIVSNDATIPVYSSTMIVGFHGENKYLYIVKEVKDLAEGHVIRILDQSAEATGKDGLVHVELDPKHHQDDNTTYGFEIITRSKFFNANKFHMYGSYVIPEGIKYK